MHSFILCAGMLAVLHLPPSEVNTTFPFVEDFDSSVPPGLPPGWTSSQNRSTGTNDFTTTSSSPGSSPNALISTNATIGQSVVSPRIDFRETSPDSVIFRTRRSSSHIAPLILEISLDGGTTFPLTIGDTLLNPGHSEYIRTAIRLPDTLTTSSDVCFRWRLIAGSSGSTGTLRIDDVLATVRLQKDLALTQMSLIPAIPGPDDPLSVSVQVVNEGLQPVVDFTSSLFIDWNADSLADPGEQVDTVATTGSFEPGDTVDVDFALAPIQSGSHLLIAIVSAADDGNHSNDTLRMPVSVRHAGQSIVINEIMFDPPVASGEYLELFNPGADSIDLEGWLIRDMLGSDGTANEHTFSGLPACPPGGFVVLAEDSAVIRNYSSLSHGSALVVLTGGSPGLNNDGDDIILLDHAGGVVDSVSYLPSWHHPEVIDSKGKALEKVSPLLTGSDSRNWSTSAASEGGTPGMQNSLYTPARARAASLTFSPNPFSPDGDGHDDLTIISFEMPEGSSTFSVRIYDITGRLIRQLATNELTSPAASLVWDGLDDQRRKARIGMYVVYLEILTVQGAVLEAKKGVVVLAGKM